MELENSCARLRRFFLASLVLALFFPALAILTVGGSGIQVYMIFLILTFVLGALEFARGTLSLRFNSSHWLLLILIGIATLLVFRASAAPMSAWTVPPLTKTLRQLFYLYAGVAIYISVIYLVRTKNDLRLVVTMLLTGGWLALIYSIGELLHFFHLASWFDWIDRVVRNNPSFNLAFTASLFGFIPRLHSLAPEQSALTLLLALPSSLALSTLMRGAQSKSDYLLASGLVLLYILSFSRLAIIALLITFGIILLFTLQSRHSSRFRFTPLALIIIGLSVVAIAFSSTGRGPSVPLPYGTDASIYTRAVVQIIALEVWRENVFGIGWGLFGYYFHTYVTPYLVPHASELHNFVFSNPRAWVPIHNVYLRFATELGIEGLIVFGVFLGSVGAKSLRATQATLVTEPLSFVPVATLAAFVAILIVSLMADFTAFGMFWFLLAFTERAANIVLTSG